MTTLPEEAVKAAKDVLYYANPNDVERALTAALPFLPVQGLVKKLEWVATGQTGFLETEFYAVAGPLMHTVHPLKDVDGPFNEHYSIHRDWNDRGIWRVTYYVGNNGLSGISKACKSLDAAKAAAQSDFEARILSALDPSAARELALEEGYRQGIEAAAQIAERPVIGFSDGAVEASRRIASSIRALSSPDHADAGKVEGDGWRQIESAPKDGTVVLAFCKDEGVVSVRFEQKHSYGRFLVCGVSDSYYGEFGVYPTHWRPLPSAPASEGA